MRPIQLFCASRSRSAARLAEVLSGDPVSLLPGAAGAAGRLFREAGGPVPVAAGGRLAARHPKTSTRRRSSAFWTPAPQHTPLAGGAGVLAIIAYNQPVSRGFVEQVRGWIPRPPWREAAGKGADRGRRAVDLPGRPVSFRTTEVFLRTFGLESLAQLPPLHGDELPLEQYAETGELPENNEPPQNRERRNGRFVADPEGAFVDLPGAVGPADGGLLAPVTAELGWSGEKGTWANVRVFGVRIRLFPRKEKAEKKKSKTPGGGKAPKRIGQSPAGAGKSAGRGLGTTPQSGRKKTAAGQKAAKKRGPGKAL